MVSAAKVGRGARVCVLRRDLAIMLRVGARRKGMGKWGRVVVVLAVAAAMVALFAVTRCPTSVVCRTTPGPPK